MAKGSFVGAINNTFRVLGNGYVFVRVCLFFWWRTGNEEVDVVVVGLLFLPKFKIIAYATSEGVIVPTVLCACSCLLVSRAGHTRALPQLIASEVYYP